ncbi:zinc finger protein-like [Canna indica]|uniref:Zinc finger protein-like n=1 Tax=Canna indica TaxID=4628 RepID=A0AAQ3KXK3_9LILI|nr:zinc finger protein-like [Canna indica]
MVVCKCRKATRLYCFVHKVPVCGECICFPEHQICVVKKYSDWVVDGEYDWPPTCSLCNAALEVGSDQTTRLGCLHLIHTDCLVSHIKSFPPETPPAGYVCPACSSPIWPPISIKDTGSCLHSKLKEAIVQSGMEKNVFGNHLVSLPAVDNCVAPPASDLLMRVSAVENPEKGGAASVIAVKDSRPHLSLPVADVNYSDEVSNSTIGSSSKPIESEIVEVDGPNGLGNHFMQDQESHLMKNTSPSGATTRKPAYHVDRQSSDMFYYADDEDGTKKKYTRRGPIRHKFLRMLLPFWSNALPTLPVTAPPRKESNTSGVPEGRTRHQRSSKMDPRKILLILAIMACLATMGILYYRLAQRSLGETITRDEAE